MHFNYGVCRLRARVQLKTLSSLLRSPRINQKFWLVRLTLERAFRVQAMARDTVLCSCARHFALTVPLSTQVCKWVPANCWGNLTICREVTCDGLASRPGEVAILQAASCYRNQLRASLGSKASLFLFMCLAFCFEFEQSPGHKIQKAVKNICAQEKIIFRLTFLILGWS